MIKKERRKKRRQCNFCADKIEHIDYKEVPRLRRYITERGKILPGESPETVPITSAS